MAVAGSGGWIPSNHVSYSGGVFHFHSITQNKPREICNYDVAEVVRLLLAGEVATIDVREEFMSQVREAIAESSNQ